MGGTNTGVVKPTGTAALPSWKGGTAGNFNPEGLGNLIGSDVAALYSQDPSKGVFPHSLYAGTGNTTDTALDRIETVANRGAGGLNRAYTATNQTVHNPLTAGQTSDINAVRAAGTGPSLTESTLMGIAHGDELGNTAPGYATLRSNAINDATTAANAGYSASGRGGSSLNTMDAAHGAADAAAGLDMRNYEFQLGRQSDALRSIEGTRQQAVGNRGAAFGMDQTGINNKMNAAALAPSLYQATLLPGQTRLGVGQLQDADRQAALNGRNDYFRRQHDAGQNHVSDYLKMLGLTPAQAQTSNPLMDLLSGVGGLGSIFL